ncbi:MAG: hypothetical protein WBC22_03425 [Sedimentisphaerales bacterium]
MVPELGAEPTKNVIFADKIVNVKLKGPASKTLEKLRWPLSIVRRCWRMEPAPGGGIGDRRG